MRALRIAVISGTYLALTACGTTGGVTLSDLAKAYGELPEDGCEHDLDVFITAGFLAPPGGSFKASRHCDAKPIPLREFGLPEPEE